MPSLTHILQNSLRTIKQTKTLILINLRTEPFKKWIYFPWVRCLWINKLEMPLYQEIQPLGSPGMIIWMPINSIKAQKNSEKELQVQQVKVKRGTIHSNYTLIITKHILFRINSKIKYNSF